MGPTDSLSYPSLSSNPLRVADGKPARSHALSDGAAGRRWLGRGARDLSVYSSGSLGSRVALVAFGLLPVWSIAMASASNASWSPAPPPGGRPWWSAKLEAGSGGVSLNKLAGGVNRAEAVVFFSDLGYHGGGREEEGSFA